MLWRRAWRSVLARAAPLLFFLSAMARNKQDDDYGEEGPPGEELVNLRPGQDNLEWQLTQPELGFEVAIAEKLEERGIYDASRLMTRKPEIYKAARKCLMMGVSPGMAAELLSIDIRTVNVVMGELEKEGSITPYKERTVWQLRGVVTLAIDGLMERAKAGELSPLDVAVLIDKIELLSGGVTQRIESKESDEEKESRRFFAAARQQLQAATGQPMVIEAEILPQSGRAELPSESPQSGDYKALEMGR
jgi:hypothetical protein